LSSILLAGQQVLVVPEKPASMALDLYTLMEKVDLLTRLAATAMETAKKYGKMSN
jgi:hypothetical protein